MEKKHVLIVIAIAIVIVAAGIFTVNLFNTNNVEYGTLKLSDTCALSVPVSNNSTSGEDNGIFTYNDTDLRIMYYNKNNLGTWANFGAEMGINQVLTENFKYNHTHQGKNIYIHPDDNKTTFASLIRNNTTGDVIMIITSNEEMLYHIIDSVNFTSNSTNISDNTTDEPAQTTENAGETTDSVSAQATDEDEYGEGYIAENDQDFDYDGDGVGDGSAYHTHEYYVQHGQTEPVPAGGG